MALPDTREATLIPGGPIPAVVLNALQDAVIGGKHRYSNYTIPACDWRVESGGNASLGLNEWTINALTVLSAPIAIRVGQRIDEVTYQYNRGGAGTITITLVKKTGAVSTVLATSTINTGTGITTTTIMPNYTMEAGYQLYIRAQCDNAAHRINNARYWLDKLT